MCIRDSLYTFWKGLLNEMEVDIAARSSELQQTALGRQEIGLCHQAKDYLRPFFRLCRKKAVPEDIKDLVVEMTNGLIVQDYAAAADAYMRLAIGKQCWLIGVSQVGLHERAAREKVYQGKITHVLNDEAQRKYITTFKRLMSFLQKQRPGDPSKMLLNA
jgi:pre-mRNA-splicing factor 18